nr:MAG TPA: hypothetical protein [Bacteriophage sp.]
MILIYINLIVDIGKMKCLQKTRMVWYLLS